MLKFFAMLDIQIASQHPGIPEPTLLKRWVNAVLSTLAADKQLTIRIVDELEITALNQQYRHKNQPTNVLSFLNDAPCEIAANYLGDTVICAKIVADEARQQNKPLEAHWALMVIHGVLHLLGYNHDNDEDAQIMQDLEQKFLRQLNLS